MIRFVLTRGLEYALDGLGQSVPQAMFRSMAYDRLIRSRQLAAATTIFTDLDRLGYADRELAGRLYRELKGQGQRVLNNPARFKNRDILLRDLHAAGLNHFRAWRADSLSVGPRFPVFVRKIQGHGLPSVLFPDRAGLDQYLGQQLDRGIPLEHLIVIEYVGEPNGQGYYRKLGVFRVGDDIIPSLCGYDMNWVVKIGKNELNDDAFYQEEFRLIRDNPYAEHFHRVFDLAGVEYGRADFGFYQGKIQVFEVNTHPAFVRYASYPSRLREESVRLRSQKLRAAFDKINSPAGNSIRLSKQSIPRRHRGWNGFRNRTRQVD